MPRAISAAIDVARAPAGESGVEQPLADAPLLERVQLDRQLVAGILGPLADADAEALAQERPDRMLDEAHQQVDLDRVDGGVGQRAREEKGRRHAVAGQGAGAVEGDRVEAPRPVGDQRTDREVAGVEGLERMVRRRRARGPPWACRRRPARRW